jgi:phosphoribosylformylglycinamidine synthase
MRLVHQGEPFIDLTVTELEQAWRGSKNSAGQTAFAQSEQNDHDRRLGSSHGDPAGPSAKRTTSNKGAYRALVLAAAGINCDREAIEACQVAGFRAESVHLNRLVGGEEKLEDFAFLVLPGGFSYGDHLGGGAMLATLFRHRLLDDLQRFVADGRPVLGICNGFQVLARLGFLGDVTLAPNAHGLFECRWVPVTATGADCVFLRDLEEMELPIAHGLGRVMFDREGRAPNVALRYRENPNGSMDDVAGVCNAAGNILGLMPHPERYLRPHHHPAWRRGSSLPPPGLILFANARQYVREAL